VAGSFTGPLKAKGDAQLQGAAFAQEVINGSDQSPRVLLELADDRSDADAALKVSRMVADDQDVAGVVGHLDSNATWTALPMYNLAGLPVISPTSTSSQLSGLSPNFFRLSPDDELQGAALARYVTGPMKAEAVTVLQPEANPHQQGLANSFARQAETLGAGVETISFTPESDWGAIAKTIKTQQPQVIFLAGSHLDALALAKAKSAAGISAPVVGGDSLYLPELPETGAEAVEGLICGSYYYSELNTPAARRFEADFKNKLGNAANSRAALTYEAVQLFAQAARVGGSSREAIAHYIKSHGRQGFDGLSGHASLDAKGNVRRPLFLMQIKQGQFVPLTHVVL
jgi:branched-chain amino acid transport system substrate-binding protein